MPDRRETMAGYHARQKHDYDTYFTIPDYRPLDFACENGHYNCATKNEGHCTGGDDVDRIVKIPAHNIVCPTCGGKGTHVNPSIDSNGITGSEMEELGEDFRESYWRGDYDVVCSECRGKNVVLEENANLTKEQQEALDAYNEALADEAQEIYYRNMGIQF